MTVLRYASANLSVADDSAIHDYDVESGSITFDESWSPYLQSNLTVTLPMTADFPPALDQAALDALDPRNGFRGVLVATLYEYDEATGELHSQDDVSSSLRISSRRIDWKAGTVSLLLTTDEFALQTEANHTSSPVNYRVHQSSLIAVVNDALEAALNLAPNGRGLIDGDPWVVRNNGGSSLAVDYTPSGWTIPAGLSAIGITTVVRTRFTGASLNTSASVTTALAPVTPGHMYTASAWVGTGTNYIGKLAVYMWWADEDGAFISSSFGTGVDPVSAGTQHMMRDVHHAQAPDGAAFVGIGWHLGIANSTTIPDGTTVYCTAALLTVGSEQGTYPTLDPSLIDADVTTTTTLTNLMSNGGFEHGTTGWSVGTGSSAIAQATTQHHSGAHSLQWTSNTTANSFVNAPIVDIQGGHTYTVSFWIRSSVARTMQIRHRYYSDQGTTQIGSDIESATFTDSSSAWTFKTTTITAPINAQALGLFPQAVSGSSGDNHFIDDIIVTEGDGLETDGVNPLAYYDGDTSPDTYYTYAWDDTAGASTSTRTPVVDRSPDSLTLTPGQSYWDMLESVVTAAGLRLFCDEDGVWRLVDGSAYSAPGTVTVQDTNATALADSIDLTQPDVVYGSVVVKYTWTNIDGNTETEYDAAGTDSPTRLVEKQNTPYPGAGAAAYLLKKGVGRGRVISTTAMSDYSARPYQGARIIAPFTQTQTGVVSRISFDLEAAEMDITTRGLIDTPAGAWVLAPDAVTWDDGNATTTWDALEDDFSNLT